MIIKSVTDIACPNMFFELNNIIPNIKVFVKLEGLNIAGSIKLVTAKGLLDSVELTQQIDRNKIIIESSSGNLGVALSIICKERGYPFVCVTDPKILATNEKLMRLYGAKIIKITEKDKNGGYLESRINYIKTLIDKDDRYIWLNQYGNHANPLAHYNKTAQEIISTFNKVDYLFIGSGTTGTLMGCAKLFKHLSPETKIIAVDPIGSVTFGNPSGKRFIPGLGTSRKPEIVDESLVDDVIMVNEIDGKKMCQYILEKNGLLLGGSSGITIQGIYLYKDKINDNATVVSIAPDFGEKYFDIIYTQ